MGTECVKGTCNMPSTMFIGRYNGQVCYGYAYGLVHPYKTGGTGCDWSVDGQSATAMYFAYTNHAACKQIKDVTGATFVPAVSAIFSSTTITVEKVECPFIKCANGGKLTGSVADKNCACECTTGWTGKTCN